MGGSTLPSLLEIVLNLIKDFIRSIKDMRGCDVNSGAYLFNLVHLAVIIPLIILISFSLIKEYFFS